MAKKYLSQLTWDEVLDKEGIPAPTSGNKICCPFHKENTPSCSLSYVNNKALWYCFGKCNRGGNVLDFFHLLHQDQYATRAAALAAMAKKYDLYCAPKKEIPSWYKAYTEVCEACAKAFASEYSTKNLDYWKSRGFSLATILEFQLGYAPSYWGKETLVDRLKNKYGIDTWHPDVIPALYESHLFEQQYDTFFLTDRYMIPIQDGDGNYIGFTGRSLSPEVIAKGKKYINNYESKYFHKRDIIFNYHNIKYAPKVTIVEGPLDALSLYEAGITTAGAIMGSHLTDEHYPMLDGKEVVLCLDKDDAGYKGMLDAVTKQPRFYVKDMSTFPYNDWNEALIAVGPKKVKELYDSLPEISGAEFILNRNIETLGTKDATTRNEIFKDVAAACRVDTLYTNLDVLAKAFFKLGNLEPSESNIDSMVQLLNNILNKKYREVK